VPAAEVGRVAGAYYQGDGLGVNWSLTVGAAGTFAFTWDGCLGRYDENEGDAVLEGGVLKLRPKKPLDHGMGKQLPLLWVPVRWGDRFYLLEEEDIPLFAKYVNQGWEPRTEAHGLFLLRRDDWKKKTSGPPVLPEKWSGLLLAQPVSARVVRVLANARAVIDKGSVHGLQVGMLLTALRGNDWVDVSVQSVDQNQAIVEAQDSHKLTTRHRITSRP
jgi:hypothetical protein